MAENKVGGIEWVVDADTKPATTSIKQMDKQVNMTEKSLTKLDVKTTKTSKAVNKGMASMGRGAGQAGIQFQQFIGQVQGGQGVMLALSQQSADLGFVLGAPLVGAIAGISASILGMLLPSLLGGKSGLENVQKAVENVKAAMTLGADGIIEYSAEMKKLKQISDALTEVKIASLIAEQNEAFKTGIKETVKLMDEARNRFALGQLFKKGAKDAVASFTTLNTAIEALKLEPTVKNINDVEKALLGVSRAGINSTKQGRALTSQMGGLIAEYKLGKMSIESLQKALKDTNVVISEEDKETKKATDSIKSMVIALQEQAKQLNETNRQTALRIATENNATQAQKTAINAAFDKIEANKEQLKTQKELDAQMNASFNADAAREKKRKAESKAETKKAITTTESIISRGDTPEERMQNERDLVESFRESNLITAQQYQDALTQIDTEGANAREQIAIMAMGSFSNSFGQLAGVLKSSMGEQSSAYKAMFALSKGFAVAQAGLNLSLAISNALASGPFPWNLGAMASVGAAGVGLISSVAGATYSGRENGGSVIGNKTYEVGEKNKPELLMIPGNNGKVLSNAEMKGLAGGGSGGGNVSVNLYGAPEGTRVESRRDPHTTEQIIDIIAGQMGSSNSKGQRAQRNITNVTGRLNAQRRS